jgi:SPP1 gp7 family putative phage head morphogenesis protein
MPSVRSKPKTLKPVHANAGIAAEFGRRLRALIAKMHASCLWWVRATYKANQPEIAQDATPADILRRAIRRLTKRWTTKFDEAGVKLGEWFAKAVGKRSDEALKKILKDAGISVEFQMTAAQRDIAQATVSQATSLIKTIPQQHMAKVEQAVMRSVQTGRDLGALSKDLREIAGVSERRAAFISRDQNNKATAAFTRARQIESGITEAVWLHSSAGKKPRPAHVGMNGKRYDVAKGMWDEDEREWVFPGQLIRCRCLCRPVVSGFS